jgi:hypothetical protein
MEGMLTSLVALSPPQTAPPGAAVARVSVAVRRVRIRKVRALDLILAVRFWWWIGKNGGVGEYFVLRLISSISWRFPVRYSREVSVFLG